MTNEPNQPQDFTVRTLGPQDVDLLADVIDQFWGTDAEDAPIRRFLDAPEGRVIIAQAGSKLVGYTYGYRLVRFDGDPIALLWDLEVKSAHRGRGIATALIDQFRRETDTQRRALLLVEPDNTALMNLCEKLGATASAPARIYRFDEE